jgi:uncharacterized membrane protein YadS
MMVLGLPLLIPLLKLSATQYGILAGLTVYAVPKGACRYRSGRHGQYPDRHAGEARARLDARPGRGRALAVRAGAAAKIGAKKISPFKLVPWFIIGFLALAALRSLGLIPDAATAPVTRTAALLTVVSMAALGLGVDVRVLANVGGKVTAAVTLSLMLLLAMSIALVQVFK